MSEGAQGLSREEILAAGELKKERVEVPEWGESVWVREMSATDMMAWSALDKAELTIPAFVAMALCDADGERICTLEDAEALGNKSFDALKRVHEAALRLNGLSEKGAKDAEENSDAARSDEPSSD